MVRGQFITTVMCSSIAALVNLKRIQKGYVN